MNGTDATSKPSRKRRIIAAALAPLGAAPLLVAGALLDGTEMMAGSSLTAILWTYVGGGLLATYGLAVPLIPIAWLIMIWTKAPHSAWAIISAFAAAFGLGGLAIGQAVGGMVMGAVLALPIAIAYALLTGASWRIGRLRPA